MAAFAFSLALAGCSADVTRFDPPSLGLNDDKPAPGPSTSYRPSYNEPPAASYPRSGLTGEGTSGVPLSPPSSRTASLPQPDSGYAAQPLPPPTTPPPANAERRAPQATAPRVASSGETIEVHAGDTLFGLARKHKVPVSALIEVNNLGANSNIKPGQKLVLPAHAHAVESPHARPVAPKFPTAKPAQTSMPPQAVAGWEGTHTMRSGESLYGIARQYRVPLSELQRVNGISEPTRVRIGAVLKVPGNARPGAVPSHAAQPYERTPAQPSANDQATPPGVIPGVRVINQPERRASLPDRANDATPAAPPAAEPTVSAPRFRWPARGRIIGSFGKRPDGTSSEGINVALPMNADIQAVEGGRVLYASNEIQAYGNLVLIQHDNGWVSAYGHADRLLVKRDDVVKKGQVIAKAGRTGPVNQPQLHFELRQGAKPVDPIAYLDK